MRLAEQHRERSQAAEHIIAQAYRFENHETPYIIYDANYWLFGERMEAIPPDYYDQDPTSMIRYQSVKIERHMEEYQDAYIPFLMPWYGTGVLASGFGVPVKFLPRMDPAVDLPTLTDVAQIRDLEKPDPARDGLMPRVLSTIRTMRETTSFPVGVTDCQGPLTTALQIVGYDQMIYWMHDHPSRIHDLMQLVTESLIEWVRVQKEAAGQEVKDDAYVLGVKIPAGYGGVWMSDDDSVIFGKDLYREFVVPYNSRLLQAFGGGVVHFCGTANQHIDNFLATDGLRAIHHLNLDHLDDAARLRHALAERNIPYIAADFNLDDSYIDDYYRRLFDTMGTRGLIVVSYLAPAIALKDGQYVELPRDGAQVGKRIEQSIRAYHHSR